MKDERDPRVDPRPGDEIARDIPQALQGCIIRGVTRAHGGFVFAYRDNGHTRKNLLPMTLGDWRRWATTAEVISQGSPDGETPQAETK